MTNFHIKKNISFTLHSSLQPTQFLLGFVHLSVDLHSSQLVGVTLTRSIHNERPRLLRRAHVGPVARQFVIMEVRVVAEMRGI